MEGWREPNFHNPDLNFLTSCSTILVLHLSPLPPPYLSPSQQNSPHLHEGEGEGEEGEGVNLEPVRA